MAKKSHSDPWVREVHAEMERFSATYKVTYAATAREVSASFEIGCFHAIVRLYSQTCSVRLDNLQPEGFKYLTSPNGNPANFSYLTFVHKVTGDAFELRQQVRITSVIDRSISFTPDLVVLPAMADIEGNLDDAYANGRRRFFSVASEHVIAAHECKSMNPFPELLVSFLGMLITAHKWLDYPHCRDMICEDGLHLAPSLFVGGTASLWHSRMISALSTAYPVNIITGMHSGTWDLSSIGVNMFNVRGSA